jgi:hypothetical protein
MITSNDVYTHGLFIADFAHMPGSTCGTWPLCRSPVSLFLLSGLELIVPSHGFTCPEKRYEKAHWWRDRHNRRGQLGTEEFNHCPYVCIDDYAFADDMDSSVLS